MACLPHGALVSMQLAILPQTKLTQLGQEAMDLVTPVLRRLLVSYSESVAQAAVEAEARLEANGLPLS
jgi:hypothetical protein